MDTWIIGWEKNVTTTGINPRACPKCSCDDIGCSFHEEKERPETLFGCKCLDEHLHRMCRNCGYEWTEDCHDKKEEGK